MATARGRVARVQQSVKASHQPKDRQGFRPFSGANTILIDDSQVHLPDPLKGMAAL
jgi:hypothetical protein